jgi:hypothetical protein
LPSMPKINEEINRIKKLINGNWTNWFKSRDWQST